MVPCAIPHPTAQFTAYVAGSFFKTHFFKLNLYRSVWNRPYQECLPPSSPLFLCEVINKYKILPNVALGWTKEKLCKWISVAFSGGTGKVIIFNCSFFPGTLLFMKYFLKYFIWGKIMQKCGNKEINERACFNTFPLIYSLHFKHALSLLKNFFRRFICKAQLHELCD